MPLKSVNNFTYLGNTVASDNTIDVEINSVMHAVSGAFGGLLKRVWSQQDLNSEYSEVHLRHPPDLKERKHPNV